VVYSVGAVAVLALSWLVVVGAGGEVCGPVGLGVGGPGDGGVDVDVEELGEDGGWELSGEGRQGGAAGAAEVDG
jgi:hypothetical protein